MSLPAFLLNLYHTRSGSGDRRIVTKKKCYTRASNGKLMKEKQNHDVTKPKEKFMVKHLHEHQAKKSRGKSPPAPRYTVQKSKSNRKGQGRLKRLESIWAGQNIEIFDREDGGKKKKRRRKRSLGSDPSSDRGLSLARSRREAAHAKDQSTGRCGELSMNPSHALDAIEQDDGSKESEEGRRLLTLQKTAFELVHDEFGLLLTVPLGGMLQLRIDDCVVGGVWREGLAVRVALVL
ncbi:hypothetical protein KCV06_g68, partial [Aureobasidium melanogenum]